MVCKACSIVGPDMAYLPANLEDPLVFDLRAMKELGKDLHEAEHFPTQPDADGRPIDRVQWCFKRSCRRST